MRLSTERLDMIPESPKSTPTDASLVRFQFVQRFAGWLLYEISLSLTFATESLGFESDAKASGNSEPVHWSEILAPVSVCEDTRT